jgi:hypothetical protein
MMVSVLTALLNSELKEKIICSRTVANSQSLFNMQSTDVSWKKRSKIVDLFSALFAQFAEKQQKLLIIILVGIFPWLASATAREHNVQRILIRL